ncbi:MAG: DUF177 domain-containing protein [Dorea sp.]|nr:DUF177 domain-containing protein [Dorea sp.]
MLLNLSDVLSEQHKRITASVPIEMTHFKLGRNQYKLTQKSDLDIKIVYAGNKQLEIYGQADLVACIPCDRCLERVEVMIPLDFYKKITTDTDTLVQDDDLDETNFIDGYNLDVEQLVFNELLVGWPTKILCSEDCKGICNVCGQNLNQGTCSCEDTGLDPRMSVIRDVFKNFKEV